MVIACLDLFWVIFWISVPVLSSDYHRGGQRWKEVRPTPTSQKAQSQNKSAWASNWKQSTVAASRWHAQPFCRKWGNYTSSHRITKSTHLPAIFNYLIYFEVFSGNRCCLGSLQGKMIMQDKLEKERNDAKNYVEEYVYDMRDKLHGMLEKFVSESVSRRPPQSELGPVLACYNHCTRHLAFLLIFVKIFFILSGPGCFVIKAGGYWKLAVWRWRGPIQTGVHWQTGRVKGNYCCRDYFFSSIDW